ncbi:MAG: hypothetical protein ACQKBU_07025, partial [Verrucomicrobiales bacterium]
MKPIAQSSTFPLRTFLARTGPQWVDQRRWVLRTAPPSLDDETQHTEGSAYCFRWSVNSSSLEVVFIPQGPSTILTGPREFLLVEFQDHAIRLSGSQIATTLLPAPFKQITDALEEARAGFTCGGASWHARALILSSAIRLLADIQEILSQLELPPQAEGIPRQKDQLLNVFEAWFDENYATSAKVADMAHYVGKSTRQVIRTLSETTGAGFTEHMTQRRVHAARALLIQSN